MPKLVCHCGFVHDLSPIPDHGWVTVLDEDFESFFDSGVVDTDEELLIEKSGIMYECPSCKRIMWKKPGQKGFKSYQIEET